MAKLVVALACLLPLITFWADVGEACKLTAKVRSLTKRPFKFQMMMPSIDMETEQVFFSYKGQQKQVTIEGANCAAKRMVMRTLRQDGAGKWHIAKEGKARLDGNGRMLIEVADDLQMHIGERMGVACSESVICG